MPAIAAIRAGQIDRKSRLENVSQNRVRLSASEAQTLAEQTLQKIGYDAEEARIIADHVVDAALCGYEYSGLPKILNVAEHRRLQQPRRPMRALHETPLSALFDGGNNNGMVAMYRATEIAIAKARENGFAAVGVNSSWVSGRSAHYVEMGARAGLIGIHGVSSRAHVAAPGSSGPATGTNPIAFAFPALNEPFVIDLGTSAFMGTDLIFQERRNAVLPEGVAIDAQGRPTRDPAQVHAILPFGGYKGSVRRHSRPRARPPARQSWYPPRTGRLSACRRAAARGRCRRSPPPPWFLPSRHKPALRKMAPRQPVEPCVACCCVPERASRWFPMPRQRCTPRRSVQGLTHPFQAWPRVLPACS